MGENVRPEFRLRVVVIADSVSRNFVRDVTTLSNRLPTEAAALSYPELVANQFEERHGRSVELVEYSSLRQTVKRSIGRLPEMDLGGADVVLVAHGGQEAILHPPQWARKLSTEVDRRDFVGFPRTRAARTVDLVRAPVWRLLGRLTQGRKTAAIQGLRRLGFCNQIRGAMYEDYLRRLVQHCRSETSAVIVLLESARSHVGAHLVDPADLDFNDSVARRIAAEFDGVLIAPRPAELSDRKAFLFDGAHLSARGHALVADVVYEVVEQALEGHLVD